MISLVPPYPLIHDRLSQGRVIPFLGAGASLSEHRPGIEWDINVAAHLPTATQLAHYLALKIRFPSDEQPDLAKVAQYYHVVGGRIPLRQELHNIFNHDYPVTSLHRFLAELPAPLLLVTTNYDDLLERTFRTEGQVYDIVIHTTDPDLGDKLLWLPHGETELRRINPNKLDIDLTKVSVIYKMHGTVNRHESKHDQYVITEDDYIDFLARMTRNKAIPAIFAELFQTRHFLFLGYGLRDWNLRVVLNRIEKDLRRTRGITSWAIQYLPSPLEQRFWQDRGVEVYNMTIEEFVKELASH